MANLPDKPMSSVMLTRLKQFTAMSKFKVRPAFLTTVLLLTAPVNDDRVASVPCQAAVGCAHVLPASVCCQVTLLNLVAKHLNPAEIGSLKDSFLAMDEDGSGFLTVSAIPVSLTIPLPPTSYLLTRSITSCQIRHMLADLCRTLAHPHLCYRCRQTSCRTRCLDAAWTRAPPTCSAS